MNRAVKDRARRQLIAVADTAVPRATSDLAGRSKPFRMLGLPALSVRVAGRQSSDFPSHLGRSRSVRVPVDGVAVSALVGMASPKRFTQLHGARRGTRSTRVGPASCSAVTLRLGPWR